MIKVFIDGQAGTTGLRIRSRLEKRDDIELLVIDEDKRKNNDEIKKFINESDITFLCLPDSAAVEAVSLLDKRNKTTKIIDASTAHRTAIPLPVLPFQATAVPETKRFCSMRTAKGMPSWILLGSTP